MTAFPSGVGNKTVLVIDDDRVFCERARQILTAQGYTVIAAGTAFEALGLARDVQPLAILLDVVLPDIGGPQLCRLLRQTPGFETTPIVFTTGAEKENVLRECLLSGGNDFIRKDQLDLELGFRLATHLRFKQEHDRVIERSQEQQALLYFARLLNRSLSLSTVMQSVVEELGRILGADRCSVILWNDNSGRILATAEANATDVELDLGDYPEMARALQSREPVFVPDIDADERMLRSTAYAHLKARDVRSILVVPMQAGGSLIGTLFVRTIGTRRIRPEHVSFCQAVAEIACRAVINARMFERVRTERDRLRTGLSPDDERQRIEMRAMLDRMRDLHQNITAEALSAISLIAGYSELLLEPPNGRGLDRRQARSLRTILERSRQLERLLRLYQSLPIGRCSGPGSVSAALVEAIEDVAPAARDRDIAIAVDTREDWVAADTSYARRMFAGLIRHWLDRLPGACRILLVVERDRVTVATEPPTIWTPDITDGFWRDVACLYGFAVRNGAPQPTPGVVAVVEPSSGAMANGS